GAGASAEALALQDVNGDGHLDLVLTDAADGRVWVLRGPGDGTFLPGTASAIPAGIPRALAIGDVNGDGVSDLIVGHSAGVSVLFGVGEGTSRARIEVAGGAAADALAVGVVNGDSHADLVVTSRALRQVTVWLGQGDGTFHSAGSYATATSPVAMTL